MSVCNIIDLARTSDDLHLQADVCLVGAGAAGLYLARRLADAGLSVVVLEAGPALAIDADSGGFALSSDSFPYAGATAGRFFGLGGSTSRWGGALVPHSRHDLRPGDEAGTWPLLIQTVERYGSDVLATLGYVRDPGFDQRGSQWLGAAATSALTSAGLDIHSGLVLPFSRKNFAGLLALRESSGMPPRILLNAVARDFQLLSAGDMSSVAAVLAQAVNGRQARVQASRFVIAAGAIESARLLLELQERSAILPAGVKPGQGLSDHLSMPVAQVPAQGVALAARLFAPRFEGRWMRSIRILRSCPGEPRAFAHFVFDIQGTGLAVVRGLLSAAQAGRRPEIDFAQVGRGAVDIARLAWQRVIAGRLHVPVSAAVRLQVDMEQSTDPANSVTLSDERDPIGRRKARVHWRVGENDLQAIARISDRILRCWPAQASGLPPLSPLASWVDGVRPYDAYHPVGTCRMGADSKAVVDLDMRVRGLSNLWVASTGVLPSAGTANPTFTLLCLAERLAQRIAGKT
jgi:choline dehydrogenase-like flavoprotein